LLAHSTSQQSVSARRAHTRNARSKAELTGRCAAAADTLGGAGASSRSRKSIGLSTNAAAATTRAAAAGRSGRLIRNDARIGEEHVLILGLCDRLQDVVGIGLIGLHDNLRRLP